MNEAPGSLSFADIVDRPIGIVRQHFGRLLAVPLIVELPLAALNALLQVRLFGVVPSPENPEAILGMLGPMYALMLLAGLVHLLVRIAVYQAVGAALDGRPPSIAEAYRTALSPRPALTVIVGALAVGVGMFCCVAPGLILWIYFAFVIPVVLYERLAFGAALRRSMTLVGWNPSKRFAYTTQLKVVLIGLIFVLVSYSLSLLIGIPAYGWGFFTMFRTAAEGGVAAEIPLWLLLLVSLGQALVTSIVGLYPAVALTLLYRDTRERMEGSALEGAIRERLGEGP
ncbi:MAG: hypothetical protein MUF27_10005 [Acidobacteria bacterium]|jgi:uncharacterized protein (DUF983 family)|nr:hypothetical protein [Acidobacteriota bacterium]